MASLLPQSLQKGLISLLEYDIGIWKPLFFYASPKYIVIDYWFVGLIQRSLQTLILIYFFTTLVGDQPVWALWEYPEGNVNAWVEGGGQKDRLTSYPYAYCSNEAYSYVYSETFTYTAPECRFIPTDQLVTKQANLVGVTTQFLEDVYEGFPCDVEDYATRVANCALKNGTVSQKGPQQCECVTEVAVFPVGVESLLLAVQHGYALPPSAPSSVREWKGTSSLSPSQQGEAHTKLLPSEINVTAYPSALNISESPSAKEVAWADFSSPGKVKFEAGSTIEFTVGDWIRAAGADLDEDNAYANDPDGNVRDSPPKYRLTGMQIEILIEYKNKLQFLGNSDKIEAKLSPLRELVGWAGDGPETFHFQLPVGPEGSQTYHYVVRYRQGVQFKFKSSGRINYWDAANFLNQLLLALVLLGSASSVTDFVAFYLLPGGHSTTLTAHRYERVSQSSQFAELGMRTALSAISFRDFDLANNRVIDPEDFVRVLGRVSAAELRESTKKARGATEEDADPPITFEKAYALALAVLDDADESGSRSLDFLEYMSTLTGGTVDFKKFLKHLRLPKDVDKDEMERMRKIWDEEMKLGDEAKEKWAKAKGIRTNFLNVRKAAGQLQMDRVGQLPHRPDERLARMQKYGASSWGKVREEIPLQMNIVNVLKTRSPSTSTSSNPPNMTNV